MTTLRRVTWPLPGWFAALYTAGIAVLVLLAASRHLSRWPPDWVAISMEFHESLIFAGPWAGVWAAVAATRWAGPNRLLCPPSAARSGIGWAGRDLAVLGVAGAVGLWIGMAPVLLDAATRATAGGPDWLVLVSGAPTVWLFIGAGYLVGCALPRTAAVITAATMMLLLTFAGPVLAEPWFAVVPVWGWDAVWMGYFENPVMSIFRTSFFGLAAAALLVAAATWANRRSFSTVRYSMSGLAVLLLPAVVIAIAGARPVHSVVRVDDPPRVCDDKLGVQVCVHAGHAELLHDLVATTADVFNAFGDTAGVPSVWDINAHPDDNHIRVSFDRRYPRDGDEWRGSVAADISWALSGSYGCGLPPEISGGPGYEVHPDIGVWVAHALAAWLVDEAGYRDLGVEERANPDDPGSPLSRLRAVPPDEVRSWIADRRYELQSCLVRPIDLP